MEGPICPPIPGSDYRGSTAQYQGIFQVIDGHLEGADGELVPSRNAEQQNVGTR